MHGLFKSVLGIMNSKEFLTGRQENGKHKEFCSLVNSKILEDLFFKMSTRLPSIYIGIGQTELEVVDNFTSWFNTEAGNIAASVQA